MALKERCSVGGVQPVVGTGMFRVNTVLDGVAYPEGAGVEAVGLGLVPVATEHVALWSLCSRRLS